MGTKARATRSFGYRIKDRRIAARVQHFPESVIREITWGAKPLRDAIAAKAKRFNGIDADPEENIVVTCGSTEAMMAAMLSLVNPGDEVVVLEPFYENYGPDAIVSGA